LGLGTEAWTDYLKFSGNYYHPLSDWPKYIPKKKSLI
ncbi:hypothetical protein GFJ82_07720, partial [Salmonella enterica subsp. enterica serovar Enteritidis]|nr:hypothetical protein [Salmonella enterica subsp. enterica serovar Enteritidis]